jgi:hypothetical protein
MGDGVKLLECDRPPIAEISKRLDDRISRKIQNFFVQDIQNDCSCNTETYDSGLEPNVFYISKEGIKEFPLQDRIPLPMKDDITEKEILDLLESACTKARDNCGDFSFRCMLYNPKSDIKKLIETFQEWVGLITFNRGEPHGWIPASFVQEDCVYFLPDPEVLGVISVNIDKFGAMCFGKNIFKVEL